MAKSIVEVLRQEYPAGTKVRLIAMPDDPRPIDPGTCGVVRSVDDIGTIHVEWENGRFLGLCLGIDSFEKL